MDAHAKYILTNIKNTQHPVSQRWSLLTSVHSPVPCFLRGYVYTHGQQRFYWVCHCTQKFLPNTACIVKFSSCFKYFFCLSVWRIFHQIEALTPIQMIPFCLGPSEWERAVLIQQQKEVFDKGPLESPGPSFPCGTVRHWYSWHLRWECPAIGLFLGSQVSTLARLALK